jgi:hypothetical protein
MPVVKKKRHRICRQNYLFIIYTQNISTKKKVFRFYFCTVVHLNWYSVRFTTDFGAIHLTHEPRRSKKEIGMSTEEGS